MGKRIARTAQATSGALLALASRTPHPAVLSFWKADTDAPGFSQQGDDWVLETKIGGTPIAIILVGTASS